MGEAELIPSQNLLIIHSVFYFYGDVSTPELANQIAVDIAQHWNEPSATVRIRGNTYRVQFNITGIHQPDLQAESVWYNDDPRINYFRIEEFVLGNISFVDGLGSNTGYFKLENLLQTGTTAAHEYGHTLGLAHPDDLDIRGEPTPGIMYPRGTICDPVFQYNMQAAPATPGGTLDPAHRRVLPADIALLKLDKLAFSTSGKARVGEFSSIYHEKHLPSTSTN